MISNIYLFFIMEIISKCNNIHNKFISTTSLNIQVPYTVFLSSMYIYICFIRHDTNHKANRNKSNSHS